MKYTKPQVAVLGDAVRVIASNTKGQPNITDAPPMPTGVHNSAYDLGTL